MLNSAVQSVFDKVRGIISPVYLVGGSVRDTLLGKEPYDYDFTTPLLPDEIEAAIRKSSKRPYLTGKRYGTVGFKIDGRLIEITTFRTESYTPGSRKPIVDFVDDITHDLSRRDFTINAMAMREDGSIIDPFGGQNDIDNKLIRTVNKPYDRYNEDPLRMLRAARFSSQLSFAIDHESEHQAEKKAHKILEVSKERWVQELDKLITSKRPDLGLNFLARTNLLNFMIPELAIQVGYNQDSPYHELNLWDHTVKTVSLVPDDLNLRWAALLHDTGKPFVRKKNQHGYSNYSYHENVSGELAEKIGWYLKWSKARIASVSQLVHDHMKPDSPLHNADTSATRK